MAHPKSMYRMTSEGVVESLAMSQDEEWALMKSGWHGHPQEARSAGVEVVEVSEPANVTRKPGRPRK